MCNIKRDTQKRLRVIIFFLIITVILGGRAEAQEEYMPGEMLVKLKQGLGKTEMEAINSFYGVSIIDHIAGIDVYRLKIPNTYTVPKMIELYKKDSRVEYAEPNYTGKGGDFVPNDTFFPQQWYLDNSGQTGGTVDADIDAVEGWQITKGSSSIIVAVLDTGIDFGHPEFEGRILPGFDFVNNDDDPQADHPHGVSVAGILAANANNSFSIAGIDQNVKILPVKVLDSNNAGTTNNLAQGLIFAANHGARVINMSLINYPTNSATLNNALQFARNAGSTLIACAGNGGIGNADISGPGASPLTISVGATDNKDVRAAFSGTGRALDVVAPGVSLPTIGLDRRNVVVFFSGCSAATPVVSGIATLLLSINSSLTHDEIHTILIETADDLVGPPSEDTPGRDDFFGYGRVNMNKAILKGLAGQQIVNSFVTFEPLGSTFATTFDTAGWPANFAGKFGFNARLLNVSGSSLSKLSAELAVLTGENLLQNADGGPAGVGATLTVPKTGNFSDGVLSPGEFVDVPFSICLKNTVGFNFLVDVLGIEAGDLSNALVQR